MSPVRVGGSPIVPKHDHSGRETGGLLDERALAPNALVPVIGRTITAVPVGDLNVLGSITAGDNAGSLITLYSNGEIAITVGGDINTLSAASLTDGRAWTHADEDGELAIRGGTAPFLSKSAAYAMTGTDEVVFVDATGGAVTITLPPAGARRAGKRCTVKKIDASANAVTVDGDGAETIDGAATYSLPARWNSVTVVSDGSNWGTV